jgi:8-oxo-dGTP pyrophosphatase MutT (NUDIX family)
VKEIHKAGLIVVRKGRVLLCRKKRGHGMLILPGGKIERGETAIECIAREVREELGPLKVRGAKFLGTYVDRAADPGRTVRIELYRGELSGEPAPHAEIGELVWFDAGEDWSRLAPSLRNRIMPDLVKRGVVGEAAGG